MSVVAASRTPVLVEELRPAPDPWQAFLRLAARLHPLFLDSALSHSTLGRYSFLTADPFEWVSGRFKKPADPFALLEAKLACFPTETVPGIPPFQGGIAGLFSYDLCHHIERLPRPRFDEFETPDLAVGFYDWVLSFDNAENRAWVVSTGLPETSPDRRMRRAVRRLEQVLHLLRAEPGPPGERHPGTAPRALAPSWPVPGHADVFSNFDRDGYLRTIRRAVEYVHAGDCFQVNIAQRLLTPAWLQPVELYRRLRERNPATFAAYFDLGEYVIASASPERFLRVEDGEVETRPIKGTRPRGATPDEDTARARELLASGKDRAENVMIVDLLRNDLGRVCQYGSVRVPAVCRLETYPFVHHLVSEVRGRLRDNATLLDLLRATFPGGSVTGAPKVRAMEIIAELEPTGRGPYCGSVGYLGFNGSMDTSILIRTMTHGQGWVQFPVGGGIVAESDPEREYDETWHKARGLLQALGE